MQDQSQLSVEKVEKAILILGFLPHVEMVHREEDVDEEGEEEGRHEETHNREQLKKDSSRELHDNWSGEGR